MCGIAGFWSPRRPFGRDEGVAVLRGMADRIASRGPDAEGYHVEAYRGLGMAHRRLSIVDLSETGAQPMMSHSGRYFIVFNGEIYNHSALRQQLSASWRGTSDTETLLAGFDVWGVEQTLKAVVGMFAFAMWDKAEECLILGRDRLGEKPLYYGWQGEGADATLLFGSDLAALKEHPAFAASIDRDALASFLRHNNVPGIASIYSGIRKLDPGTVLRFSAGKREPQSTVYWSLIDVIGRTQCCRFVGDPNDSVDALDVLLRQSIREQMVADVPLGAFLSGGIDSSLVTALMQSESSAPIRSFSIGFEEANFNEAQHARAVAAHLGTDHTDLTVSAHDALSLIPQLPAIYSEPFADASQIPTYLLARMTRAHVTVALSGDAGDELFCGYNRYQMADRLWPRLSTMPLAVRNLASRVLLGISPRTIDRWGELLGSLLPQGLRSRSLGEMAHKGALTLASRDTAHLYENLISHWTDPAAIALGSATKVADSELAPDELAALSPVEWMMAQDILGYLPDDILTKVDRAAMAASLETRVPFLDHRIVEFAWSLPVNVKLRDGQSKWPLRQLLDRHVPRVLTERPKAGFAVPIAAWLRGPLRDWAEDLINEDRLRREGFLAPAPIRKIWADHLAERGDWHRPLWNVLMFQAWLVDIGKQ